MIIPLSIFFSDSNHHHHRTPFSCPEQIPFIKAFKLIPCSPPSIPFIFFQSHTMKLEEITLWRSSSTSCRSSRKILPSTSHNRHNHHARSPSTCSSLVTTSSDMTENKSPLALSRLAKTRSSLMSILNSLIRIVSFPGVPSCGWLALPGPLSLTSMSPSPHLRRKVTGTLFGHRRGHVTFAVQDNSRSDPVILIELAISTSDLVKEMSSGLLRIALECEKSNSPATTTTRGRVRLYNEPVWSMYCNGRKCGYAMSRACSELDLHVLRTVQSVSVGAGVIPQLVDPKVVGGACEGELLYMRARFERVAGTRDSEAFYMLNPDGTGGPELSIFLLRL